MDSSSSNTRKKQLIAHRRHSKFESLLLYIGLYSSPFTGYLFSNIYSSKLFPLCTTCRQVTGHPPVLQRATFSYTELHQCCPTRGPPADFKRPARVSLTFSNFCLNTEVTETNLAI